MKTNELSDKQKQIINLEGITILSKLGTRYSAKIWESIKEDIYNDFEKRIVVESKFGDNDFNATVKKYVPMIIEEKIFEMTELCN